MSVMCEDEGRPRGTAFRDASRFGGTLFAVLTLLVVWRVASQPNLIEVATRSLTSIMP